MMDLKKCQKDYTVLNKEGLHARPSASLVERASRFTCEITISNGDIQANAKSLIGVLMLEASCGTTLTVKAHGEDAEKALDAMKACIEGVEDEETSP